MSIDINEFVTKWMAWNRKLELVEIGRFSRMVEENGTCDCGDVATENGKCDACNQVFAPFKGQRGNRNAEVG